MFFLFSFCDNAKRSGIIYIYIYYSSQIITIILYHNYTSIIAVAINQLEHLLDKDFV